MHSESQPIALDSPEAFQSRELSWLAFAARVLAMAEDPAIPLLERVKFAGILGMLHDEFYMKRVSGLKRQAGHRKHAKKRSLDGRTPSEELEACRLRLFEQHEFLARLFVGHLKPELAQAGLAVLEWGDLDDQQRGNLREWFRVAVYPILTPLAVDAEHPFPFISSGGLNLAVVLGDGRDSDRFLRIKVPGNRPRWVPIPGGGGFVPMEQVIEANLDILFPSETVHRVDAFRVTRGASGESTPDLDDAAVRRSPGGIVRQVADELKARRFAGVVRLEVGHHMPGKLRKWLAQQLEIDAPDVTASRIPLRIADLSDLAAGSAHASLRFPPYEPVTHPRLEDTAARPAAIFDEIRRGDLLLHHPYHDFDTSVLRFLEAAAEDPAVLAIKMTIYRTSSGSAIVQALADAARRGKQVAVLVEINARFDEAPNIAWGKFLEAEGVHVSYGVERLKTHVKLALVVRDETDAIRRYVHVGTGNYHSRTARLYEDVGILTCDPEVCDDVSTAFNELTGATQGHDYRIMLVAPHDMRERFSEMIRREADHAEAGRPCGIVAKMNQLQDPDMIRELYRASRSGVPILLLIRGLCCLRPGVEGLSENIRVVSVVGRFLEHSRVYHFVNGGRPEYYLGSADWMKRNLNRRVETIVPVRDPSVQSELGRILAEYERDNASAWDCDAEGEYTRRRPEDGEPRRAVQEVLIQRAKHPTRSTYQIRG